MLESILIIHFEVYIILQEKTYWSLSSEINISTSKNFRKCFKFLPVKLFIKVSTDFSSDSAIEALVKFENYIRMTLLCKWKCLAQISTCIKLKLILKKKSLITIKKHQ